MSDSKNLINKIIAVEKEAIEFGFEWPNNEAIIKQAISECNEILESINLKESKDRLEEEIGDLIHCAFSLSVFNDLDPEEILEKIYHKFSKRIKNLKLLSSQKNISSFHGKSTEFMLELWDQAKKLD